MKTRVQSYFEDERVRYVDQRGEPVSLSSTVEVAGGATGTIGVPSRDRFKLLYILADFPLGDGRSFITAELGLDGQPSRSLTLPPGQAIVIPAQEYGPGSGDVASVSATNESTEPGTLRIVVL